MPARNAIHEVESGAEEREISATRIFDAPRDLVWKMFTEPDHIAHWWGPNGFTNTIDEMDVRPGGVWSFTMHGPDGRDYKNKSIYVEVLEPERIVFDHVSGPLFRAIVNFTPRGNKTEISWRMIFETAELRDKVIREYGAAEGLKQNLERLADALSKREFVIARTFDAPREVLWKAWTEPERMARWFGPRGVKIFHSKNDLRPGGTYHFGMLTPDGGAMWGKWVYREVAKPERLVFVNSFSDQKLNVTRHPMHAAWPLEMLSTVTFVERNGKTTVTVHSSALNASPSEQTTFDMNHDSMRRGWSGTFDALETDLAKESGAKVLELTRVFDAPPSVVFKAWTDAKQLARWWGPHGFTNPVCEVDVRPGGAIRIDMRGPDGTVYPMGGYFREIREPERLVFTATAHGGALEVVNIVTLTEEDGKTRLTLNARVVKALPVAAMAVAGMDQGWSESLVRLDELMAGRR